MGMTMTQKILAAHAGLSADKVTFIEAKLDRDDGRQVYELEFFTDTKEYEYKVDAATGNILKAESEKRT